MVEEIMREASNQTVTSEPTVRPPRRRRGHPMKDIAGQRFRMLTALYPTEKRDRNSTVVWHCRCDCGREVDTYVSTTSTPQGTTGTTSANFTVTNSETSTVTFTNTYQKATTSITLKKVDAESPSTTLNGAKFTLSDGSTSADYTVNGTYEITGITYGKEYTLTETKAPDGYNLLTESITFTVNSDNTITVSGANATSDGLTLTVTNKAGFVLPSTGGTGTWMYTLTGLTLCGAALVLWKRRETD